MKRKILVFLVFVCLFVPGVGFAQYDYNSKEFQEIISQLDMQGHAIHDLSTCSVKQMYYEEVVEMLNEGMTEKEIIAYYVDQYGQAALREPGFDKSGLIAWAMPAAGLTAGMVIVVYWLKLIKGKGQMASAEERKWESETEREIMEKIFEEERRKHF